MTPHDRIDAWNAAFGSLNEIIVPSQEGIHPGVRSENWLLGGGLVLSETRVDRAMFRRDLTRTRRDQIDHWVVRVVRKGLGHLRHKDFEVTTRPGDLVLFSVDETWMVDWHDVEWVSLCFPREFDLRLSSGLQTLQKGILRGPGAGLLADLLLALPARVAAASAEDLPRLGGIVHTAVTSCLLGDARDRAPAATTETAAHLAKERVRRAILREIHSTRLTPARLASAAGLSRSALYRLYEAEGGVARHIRHMRLTLAHAALQDPSCAHKSIATIAEEHGFPDPPEFSRAFRALFGLTPSDARRTGPAWHDVRPAPPVPGRAASNLVAAIYRPPSRSKVGTRGAAPA